MPRLPRAFLRLGTVLRAATRVDAATRLAAAALLLAPLFALVPILGCGHTELKMRIHDLEIEADRQAVTRLIAQYAHGIDGHDEALLRRTFTADAVAEYEGANFPMHVRLDGFPAILEWLNAQVGQREGAVPWHFMDTELVEVDGNRAKLKAYQHNRTLAGIGVYTIEAVRTSQGWRIQKLHLDERILDPKLLEDVNQPATQERIRR